jgi:hypothetical protein
MIARKNTLEITNSRRSDAVVEAFHAKEFSKDVAVANEIVSPLDDVEFCSSEPEPSPPEQPIQIAKPAEEEKCADSPAKQDPWQRLRNLPRKYYPVVGLVILCIAVGTYLLIVQTYTAETRLVFIIGDRKFLEKENWSPTKELSFLQNPKTSSILTSRYFNTMDPVNLFKKADDNSIDSLFSQTTVLNPTSVRKDFFKTSADFESWFSKSISMEPDFYGGQNAVSLKLTGPDPQLLKGVLLDYVSSYVDLRKVISAKAREKQNAPAPKEDADNSANLKTLENLNERIRKLDTLLSDYQMAMKLLKSADGTTNSFSLDPSSPIFSTVARFQDKIIQLEIERGSLETRFTPQSREIKSVEYQIDGVKALLNQYIVEQVNYLNKDKEMLVTQKTELENSSLRKPESTEPTGSKDMNKSSGMLASGAQWYFVNEGISVINENPFISSKPLLAKIGDLKDALVAGLSSSGNSRHAPSGPYMSSGTMNGLYGVNSPPTQSFGPPPFQRGPTSEPVSRQSMDFYHNDTNSFVRR